ncbi:amidophosphoribosyltransferase [Collinsella sp. AGMB00827]|uniref:Amidophosphoribosyltransferase n=1 Tax=Collinsella ureilytica TaxID=2869515 RepID=A0ABS7MK70_9ACTN|nr:amidophosphoribosyltransferase [Collinsella urealyticum]MBY4797775.1 amidophosphoribosyltransferase [Collinsella urealyticum]
MSQETVRAAELAAARTQALCATADDLERDELHEECGIFGVWAPNRGVARLTYFGLRALQHRGQESAGIAVGDGGTVMVRKDLGLLGRVFSDADLSALAGDVAVGHVRYGTAGAKSWEAAQPHLSTINDVIIALAHNGTLVNTDELRRQLIELGVPFLSNSDSEVAAKLIGYFTQRTSHLREGIRKTMEIVRGGYAMTLITEQALYAFRDPHGIRPLVLGRLVDQGLDQLDLEAVSTLPVDGDPAAAAADEPVVGIGGWVVASETCALDIVGAEYVRDVRPGEILRVNAEGLISEQGVPAETPGASCIFEQVYFARPDSIMDGKSVYACRYDMGRQLAIEAPAEADLVIGVPDSGLPPAEGFAHESGLRFGEGLIKNRYVARTFIEPTQELRSMGVRMKLNPLRDTIAGKRLVVIDDSIVRGTTMVQLVRMLRQAGAREIHVRINSPEVIWPCFYGIDTDVQSQLISASRSVDEICEMIGADSLAFLSMEGLLRCMPERSYCAACFTGCYPVAIPETFGREKFMDGYRPRNLGEDAVVDEDAVVQKGKDRTWELAHQSS